MAQATSGAPSAGFSAPATLSHLPRGVLACIASQLDSPKDRLGLEASCHTLLDASRGELSSTFWGGPKLLITLDSDEEAAQVAALLAARRPGVAALVLETVEIPYRAPVLPSPPLAGLEALHLANLFICRAAWQAVLRHSGLTSLRLQACLFATAQGKPVCTQPLRALPALQHVEMSGPASATGYPIAPQPSRHLAGCSQLTSLDLRMCNLGDMPPGLSTLTALRKLKLWYDDLRDAERWAELGRLPQLTHLHLELCLLEEVPAPLSRLTGLHTLVLRGNWNLERRWERLAPLTGLANLGLAGTHFSRLPAVLSRLTGLQGLVLFGCNQLTASDEALRPLRGHPSLRTLYANCCESLAAVPAVLSTLRSLQLLAFNGSRRLAEGGGWHHLAGLSSLTRLDLLACGVNEAPPELAGFAQAGILRLYL